MNPLNYVAPIVAGALCLGVGLVMGLNQRPIVVDHIVQGPAPVTARVVSEPWSGSADPDVDRAVQIAWSLLHQGDEWRSDNFNKLLRRGDVCIWTGDDAEYLEIGRTCGDVLLTGDGDHRWKPSSEERQLIWDAIQRWIAMNPLHGRLQFSDINP